jgi:hypothetical protein
MHVLLAHLHSSISLSSSPAKSSAASLFAGANRLPLPCKAAFLNWQLMHPLFRKEPEKGKQFNANCKYECPNLCRNKPWKRTSWIVPATATAEAGKGPEKGANRAGRKATAGELATFWVGWGFRLMRRKKTWAGNQIKWRWVDGAEKGGDGGWLIGHEGQARQRTFDSPLPSRHNFDAITQLSVGGFNGKKMAQKQRKNNLRTSIGERSKYIRYSKNRK